MNLAIVWLVVLTIALVASGIYSAQWALNRRWPGLVSVATCLACGSYCLLAVDAAEQISAADRGLAFLLKGGVLALAGGVLFLHVVLVRWLLAANSGKWQRRGAWIGAILLMQIAVAGVAVRSFQSALAATKGPSFTMDLELEGIQGEALVTDRGRIVPVFRVKDNLSSDTAEEWQFPATDVAAEAMHSNCHGWVFTRGRYIVNTRGVEMILADNGYEVVTSPRPGDVIVYRDAAGTIVHSGLVRAAERGQVWVESKWGVGQRYVHQPEDQSYSTSFAYYRTTRDPEWLRYRARHLVKLRTGRAEIVAASKAGEDELRHAASPVQMTDANYLPIWTNNDLPIGAE